MNSRFFLSTVCLAVLILTCRAGDVLIPKDEKSTAPAPAKTDSRESALDKAYAEAPDNMEVVYAWIRARVDARRDLTIKPVKRAVPAEVPKELRFIADSPPSDGAREKLVSRSKLLADVDDLELILENCYAYLERRGADYRGALDALRASLTKDTPLSVFSHRVERLLTVFGDPHSAVRSAVPRGRHLSVLFVMDGAKLVALAPGRGGYFAKGFPYCTEIKDRPVAEWIAAAEHIVPQASPQYRRYLALRQLSDVETVAREMSLSLEPGSPVSAVFESADGKERKTVNLEASRSGEGEGRWRRGDTEVRSDGLGYLRLSQMASGDSFIAELNDWMGKFKDTSGLIIDVRGNSGGTQDAIKTVLPWLMKPGSPLKVVNVAAYRLPVTLPKPNPSGFLGLFGRGLHPVTSTVWTPQQASEIKAFLKTWEPKWKLPAGKFSDWHVMALNHESNPAAGYYDKPVVVLMDERCYSATDNFLGALKGHLNITLMGTTSGGGSGRMANYILPNTRLSLTLCQMASFASNGQTYDGNGVTPDVVAEPKLEDQLAGHGDSVLDAAVARLKK